MKIDKLFFENTNEIIGRYKNNSINILKQIEPLWAYDQFVDKLFDRSLHPENLNRSYARVCVNSLVDCAEFLGMNMKNLFINEELNDHRIAKILFHWENKSFIDPPHVYFSSDDKICFVDGRHRTKVTYFLGEETMPIVFEKSDLGNLAKIIPFR